MAATQELRSRDRRRLALVTAAPVAAITIAVAFFAVGAIVGGEDALTLSAVGTGGAIGATAAERSVPDAEATDGVYPRSGGSTTMRPTVTNDDAYYAEMLALERANRGEAPVVDTRALYESPIVESSLFEFEVERMLEGMHPTGIFPPASSITDDPELRAMIEEHQAWLEYELEMANR